MIFRLRNSKLISKLLSYRSLKTSPILKGGSAAVTSTTKSESGGALGFFKSLVLVPEHPKLHQGYLYREAGNLQGSSQATSAKILLSLVWYYIFYNLWSHSENLFGHMAYPDTSKWTNAELGIPPDDEE